MFNVITQIPILYKLNWKKISVTVCERAALQMPFNNFAGDVVIPEMYINELDFPETLSVAKNGFTKTGIRNETNNII